MFQLSRSLGPSVGREDLAGSDFGGFHGLGLLGFRVYDVGVSDLGFRVYDVGFKTF